MRKIDTNVYTGFMLIMIRPHIKAPISDRYHREWNVGR